jgi:hypothetical protein
MSVFRFLNGRYRALQANKAGGRMLGELAGRPSRFGVESHPGLSRPAQVSEAGGFFCKKILQLGHNRVFKKLAE